MYIAPNNSTEQRIAELESKLNSLPCDEYGIGVPREYYFQLVNEIEQLENQN